MHLKKQYTQHEYVQTYIRIFIIFLATAIITYYAHFTHAISSQKYEYIMLFPLFMFGLSLFHVYFIRKYPYLFQTQRIIFMSFIEVVATAYVMYLVGPLSAYFPVLFLWYSVGYGVRYGEKIGFITYGMVLMAWLLLLDNSPYWMQNKALGLGWLIAYMLIPLYFFKLLQKLHIKAKEADYQATHDTLTGLSNRLLFDETLQQYIVGAKEKEFALVFIDLDGFKAINDTFGHLIGDKVLVEASRRVKKMSEVAARLGGDEFICIIRFNKRDELKKQLDNLFKNLHQKCDSINVVISASLGVSIYPHDAVSAHELKKKADIAMYKAKESGKSRYYLYSELTA